MHSNNKMKYFLILLIVLLNLFEESTINQVVNSCGNEDYKASNNIPQNVGDCKDKDEPYCKFVSIEKGGENKSFCAIIHGKYNDPDVINDVKALIKADILTVSSSLTNSINYIIYFLLTFLLF